MRRTLSIAALALAAALPARAGWIEQQPDRTVVHLSLFSLPDPTRTDAPGRADAAVAREFVRRFPDLFAARYAERARTNSAYGPRRWDRVEVELHAFSGIQVESLESDLMAIAGGVAPDVLYVNFRKSDTYIRNGFLRPLDLPADGYFTSLSADERAFRIHPKLEPVVRRRGPGGAEHVWAMPYAGALGKVMLYRKDLFDAAGVAHPTADWTWDDLLAACRKLSDPARGVWALKLGRSQHESAYWINFLWSAGGEVMTYEAARDDWQITFDSEAGARALDFYTRLCTEPWTDARGQLRRGYAYKDTSQSQGKWERGELAIAFDYVEEKVMSRINPDLTGMAPIPKGPGGQRGAELNSRMMGLFADIPEPAVRDAAWEYIRFFDSPEAAEIRTRILVEGGFGRFLHPDLLRRFGYDELVRLAPPGWAETFAITMDTGHPEPYGRNSNMAYVLMTDPIQQAEDRALAGTLPADEPARLAALRTLLQRAGDQARRQMLEETPPRERTARAWTAALFLLAMGVALLTLLPRVARAFRAPVETAGARPRGLVWAGVLLAPALLTVLVWQYLPLLRGSLMAFQDYRLLGTSRFTGLENLGAVLWDGAWWSAVYNSLRFSVLVIVLTFLPPLLLAILLQESPRGRVILRTLYYLPAVMSGLVVLLLWKTFYEPSEHGALNAVLMRVPAAVHLLAGLALAALAGSFARRLWFHHRRLPAFWCGVIALLLLGTGWSLAAPGLGREGLGWLQRLVATPPEPYRWLTDSSTALLACVLPLAWAGVGPGSLIYLAALKGVPDELYEAADLDGAGFVDKVLFIVFPLLRPLLVINFVGVFIGAWIHASAGVLALTGGGARTEVADLHIFYKAYLFLQFGPATAMAWVLAFLLIGFTVQQLTMLSRLEFRAAKDAP